MIEKRYPQGKKKAFNVTYDDGVLQDARFVQLLNKYGLKGTFNLNSELMQDEFEWVHESGCTIKRLSPIEAAAVYVGHEVASHTLNHPQMEHLPEHEVMRQLREDKENLGLLYDEEVRGFAVPFEYYSDMIEQCVKNCGFAYGRISEESHAFAPQNDFYRWKPTVFHTDSKLEKLTKQFLAAKEELACFQIVGHTYDLDVENLWEKMEKIFKKISEDKDVLPMTTIEIVDYLRSMEYVEITDTYIKNNSLKPLWFAVDGEILEVQPGETAVIGEEAPVEAAPVIAAEEIPAEQETVKAEAPKAEAAAEKPVKKAEKPAKAKKCTKAEKKADKAEAAEEIKAEPEAVKAAACEAKEAAPVKESCDAAEVTAEKPEKKCAKKAEKPAKAEKKADKAEAAEEIKAEPEAVKAAACEAKEAASVKEACDAAEVTAEKPEKKCAKKAEKPAKAEKAAAVTFADDADEEETGKTYAYMLECSDGSLYTGWTNNLEKRLAAHNAGTGAKYTRSRTPVKLAYFEEFATKQEAMQREAAIKKMKRPQKLKLMESKKEN